MNRFYAMYDIIRKSIMATIVQREGGGVFPGAQPYDKIGVLGFFGKKPQKWGGGGDTPKMAILGGFPPLPGGGPKWPFWGSRGGPKWPFWALPPLIKDRFSRF